MKMYRKLQVHRLRAQCFFLSFIPLLLLFQSFFLSKSFARTSRSNHIKNEMGYLFPDSIGSYHYVCMLSDIDSVYKNFGNIWKIHVTPEYLYFTTIKYYLRRDSIGINSK